MYGIVLAALVMIGTLPVALTINGYGPISDNSRGISEISGLTSFVHDHTDALNTAGNTTAAVGKGFAIGWDTLIELTLFSAFVTREEARAVDILQPTEFSWILVGAMLPYSFSALTTTAGGDAAQTMMTII